MKPKLMIKVAIDIAMTGSLLFLMAYVLVGEVAHEWLGMGMFVLFVLHHILNAGWLKNIGKGKYTAFRTVQTVLTALVLCTMLGTMISGIILSRYVFAFLPAHGGQAVARTVHLLCGHWGFVLMSLHLGQHWSRVVAMTRKSAVFRKETVIWICRVIAVLIAGYGCCAFYKRQMGDYLFFRMMFAFFDHAESLWRFILDHMAVMGLFVFISYYAGRFLSRLEKKDVVKG